jgi:hypothetical protein
MHPGLDIAGRQDGYFDNDDDVIRHINDSGADMLFVAMGSPRQEKWINKHRDRIYAPYCMGVGGTLDVVNGNVKWAPKFFRKTGTEFLYRLISQPKRIKRQKVLPKFMFLVFKAMLLGQKPPPTGEKDSLIQSQPNDEITRLRPKLKDEQRTAGITKKIKEIKTKTASTKKKIPQKLASKAPAAKYEG